MNKDAKFTLGFTCVCFAGLHLSLLAGLMLMPPSESKGGMLIMLELPAFAIWPPPAGDLSTGYWVYLFVVGTLMHALIIGVPAGSVIIGVRRLFNWLNETERG